MHITPASPWEPKSHLPKPSLLARALPALLLLLLLLPNPGTHAADQPTQASPTRKHASILEATGSVLHSPVGQENWNPAQPGLALNPGDRLQTGPDSRAALLLSDHSVLRISEQTLILIQPPEDLSALQRFRLILGKIFFFDREEPRRIEFETPLATGAIRGTEFILECHQSPDSTQIAMLDGEVSLQNELGSLSLTSGQTATVTPRSAPVQTHGLPAEEQIQWTLYYPAVINPDDLHLSPAEKTTLTQTLALYHRGNLPQALLAYPTNIPSSSHQPLLAAIKLAVGNAREAQSILSKLPQTNAPVRALNTLLAAIQHNSLPNNPLPLTSSEWLALSYFEQSHGNLKDALHAATQATSLAPQLGYAHARLAELLLTFNRYTAAEKHLQRAQSLSPDNPLPPTLHGFTLLDQNQPATALTVFHHATALDPAMGLAWLGQGLASLRLNRLADAETALLNAAALEPNRSAFRSALARLYADSGNTSQAAHELELATSLDPGDPTPWLYSALLQHQLNQPIPAIESMERSRQLNDHQAIFRSRLLLDRDKATRSANLATLYSDTGLDEPSQRAASRSLIQDYSNPAGHLFLANSYQQLDDPYRTNLRLETARQSELLIANLLAPPGSGNLSQMLSQQDHLRLLQPPQTGFSSLTEATSQGDWSQSGSVFGNLGEFSYAVDAQYRSLQGDWDNQDLEEFLLSAQIKEQLTLQDTLYLQIGTLQLKSGDTARHLNPANVNPDIRTREHQRPFLHLGLNHAWSPEHHTLLLGSFLEDQLNLEDPDLSLPFVRMNGTTPGFITPAPLFAYSTDSHDRLGSAELQHIWQTEPNTLVIGSRAQLGEISTTDSLSRAFTGPISQQSNSLPFNRVTAYAYDTWQILQPLHLTAGFSYDHLEYPENSTSSLAPKTTSTSQWSPKAGIAYQPHPNTELRAAYSQSLGGLYFDNSLRLEPTQIAGWNQAYRSLAPESVAGQIPAAHFDSLTLSIDHQFPTRTYTGAYAEWLQSSGTRPIGILTNSTFLPIPDTTTSTPQDNDYDERSAGVYLHQIVDPQIAASISYRFSQAQLHTTLPRIPQNLPGLDNFQDDSTAQLHHLNLQLHWNHPCGAFAHWQSGWFNQTTSLSEPTSPSESIWLHDLFIGYRLHRRSAILQLGILNLTGENYRLHPLNLLPYIPHERTYTASLRLNF